MNRLHLLEIHDQDWCPRAVRNALTDHLQFSHVLLKPYAAMLPVLTRVLEQTGARRILDLGSGGGGPWAWLAPALRKRGMEVSVCLTDKYPNLDAAGRGRVPASRAIRFHEDPVDATRVPEGLVGFRTMFTAFHHLRPDQARDVLADAVRKRQGIAIFEVVRRSARAFVFALLMPLLVLLLTPFLRPFRWSRLFWTYMIPLVPVAGLFDALVSCLRAYSNGELRDLVRALGATEYDWEVGTAQGTRAAVPVTYLIGIPRSAGQPPGRSLSAPVSAFRTQNSAT